MISSPILKELLISGIKFTYESYNRKKALQELEEYIKAYAENPNNFPSRNNT